MNKIENEDEYSPLDQWLHKQMDKHFWHAIFTVLVVAVVCSIVVTVTSTPEFENVVVVGDGDDLAYRLGDAGWILYTTSGCGFCEDQKDMMGDSTSVLLVECDASEIESEACIVNDIEVVPTWVNFKTGERAVGLQNRTQLEVMING